MSETPPPKSLVRRLLVFATVTTALVAGLVVWIWNGPASPSREPVASFEVHRQADGSWTERPRSERSFRVALGATERVAQTNTSASQGVAAAQGARFPTRSILVRTVHDTPMEQAIAVRIVDGLQQDDFIRRIAYRPRDAKVQVGHAWPDLVLEIDLDAVDDDMLFGSGSSHANLMVRVSTGLHRGSVHVTEHQPAPPVVDLGLEISVDAKIEQQGFATPNLVFEAVARELGDPVVQHLAKELPKLREQYGVYPTLPPTFAVEYRPLDDAFDLGRILPEDVSLQHLGSWCGPLVHNESWWSGRIDASREAVLGWVAASMEEAGFESVKSYADQRLKYRKDSVVVVFDAVKPRRRMGMIYSVEDQPKYIDLYVRYRHPASAPRVAEALASVLDDGVAPEVLLACLSKLEGDARARGLDRVRALDLDDPADLVLRARAQHGAGDTAGAADDLLRALLFAETSFHRQKQADKAEAAAKQLKIELDRYGVASEWLQANGFRELTVGGDAIEAAATGSDPVRCFVMSRDHDGNDVARLFAVGPDYSEGSKEWLGSIRVFDYGHTSTQGQGGAGERTYRADFGVIHYEFVDSPEDARAAVRIWLR